MSKDDKTTTPVDVNEPNTVDETVNQNEDTPAEAAVDQMPPDSIPESSAAPEQIVMETDTLKSQNDEYLALVQRTRAEFANYKKRTEREMSEARQRGALDAVTSLLPVIDDFERAMENVPQDMKDNAWVNGISLLMRQLEKMLAEYHVVTINPTGERFDPTRHEAIGMEDSDTVESGHVTVTLRKGYSSGERVLRPALVKVAS